MHRIALYLMRGDWPLERQTPGRSLEWGGCRFFLNPEGGTFDYCAVYDETPVTANILCPPDKTLLITGEPPSIKYYDERYIAQFHSVLTCHSDLPHPRRIYDQQAFLWYAGIARPGGGRMVANLAYDDFRAEDVPEKTRLLSVVVSDKAVTPGHRHRRAFVARLRDRFGDRLAIYGRGINDIADKAEAIRPARYHVVLESSQFPDYWTEKLADAFLCTAFPFYWGAPNLARYFPEAAFVPINIYDADASVALIEREIAGGRFERSLPALREAKALVLDRYNMCAMLAERFGAPSQRPAEPLTIRPEPYFRHSVRKKLSKRLRRALPRSWRKKEKVL